MKKLSSFSDVARQFGEICGRASDLGLECKEVGSFPVLQRVWGRSVERSGGMVVRCVEVVPLLFSILFLSLAMCLGGLLVYVTYLDGLRPALEVWVEDVLDGSLAEDKCVLELAEVLKEQLRPPVPSCAFCQNMTRVDVLAGLTRQEFEERYAYSSRPLLVTDAMDNWSAVELFSFDYLKSLYANTSPDAPVLSDSTADADCQFFPYATEFANLSQVFAMSPERYAQPWYIGWSNCDSRVANVLREHYRKPYFLPAESESSKLDWIFMGRPGLGAHMHIDNVDNPSWQAQVRGVKTWTLEPPPECYFQCEGVQDGIDVTVRPGQVIVLDTNIWYHKTEVTGPDISIVIGSEYD